MRGATVILFAASVLTCLAIPFSNDVLRANLRPRPADWTKPLTYELGVITWWAALPDLTTCANIAINDINNRTDILPHANINPTYKDGAGSPKVTLPEALELVGNDWSGVTGPPIVNSTIILGPLRSVSTILANNIYELRRVPGVSSTSTSVELSDTATFPFFSRVIGSDAQQGRAMARFCHHFGWYKIAILFTSDSYSSSITTEFLKAGKSLRPQVEAVVATSFISGSDKLNISLATQAALIRDSKAIVIYAPLVQDDLIYALSEFDIFGLKNAPYIWLGADGWFSLTDAPPGSIMSVPYTPSITTNYTPVHEFQSLWDTAVAANLTTNLSSYSIFCPYQYDAVHLIARGLAGLDGNQTQCRNAIAIYDTWLNDTITAAAAANVTANTFYDDPIFNSTECQAFLA